jgi:hypothetical protein
VPDQIGGFPVTDPPVISAFPIKVDWGGGMDYNPPIYAHIFDETDLKTEQRFVLGSGMKRMRVRRDHLTKDEYQLLKSHWLQAQAQYASFPITVQGAGSLETWNVRYENPNLSFDQMVSMLTGDPGLTMLVLPDAPPSYSSVTPITRFPDQTLSGQLAAQTQHIYPLLTIQDQMADPNTGALLNPPNYFSNQRVTVGSITYLPRLLSWSGITQTLSEASDAASFTFGNADGAFTQWANHANLFRAAVQFSLYHAESGYLIYLWAGYALPWSLDTSGKFVLPCSSGTYFLTLGYPVKMITRTCWKVYKGRFCPSTSSLTSCPKDFASCVARGVEGSFGGVVVPQNAIRVKDGSTGVLGWGRSWMTSVTVTADTIYQNPLQEVWTDEAMSVPAVIMAGRDENDFYAALGFVSDGPIGGYNPNLILQSLDGYPPHDPWNYGGVRGVVGNDPAYLPYDWVAISQQQPDPNNGGKPTWNLPPPGATYSGGLAFMEIRRTDTLGLQLTPLTDHTMKVSITQGVSGWQWTAPGARVWVKGISNCVWVAVNVYLRAVGLRLGQYQTAYVPASVMEQYFDVNQAIAAASICDLIVAKIIPATTINEPISPGTQTLTAANMTVPVKNMLMAVDVAPNQEFVTVANVTMDSSNNPISFTATFVNSHAAGAALAPAENQFPFRGILKERKPVKDWLTEILNCCCGYWCFVNGKLWIGIRENASVGTNNAFTAAHVKWKTLQLQPVQPQFNWLSVQFGDEEYDWQLNTATIYDIDHAGFVGTVDSPQYMQSSMTLVGCSNLSQATRVGVTRLREELGGLWNNAGVNEQLNARNFTFSTTILSLTTMVGDVISLTHPMVPGGVIKGRVQSWTLNPDFSINITAKCVTVSMYALDMGPKPADVQPPLPPVPTLAWVIGLAWMPDLTAPQTGDPIFTDSQERTFALWQDYFITADGTWSPAIFVSGYLPANTFADVAAPRIADINIASGGSLQDGATFYFCLVVYNAAGEPTKLSNLAAIWIPAATTGQQVNMTWMPPATGTWSGWEIFAGNDRRTLARQDGGSGVVPETYTFKGPLHAYTLGLPSPYADYVQIGVKHEIHAGVAGVLVTSPPTTNQIQSNDFIGATDNWVNRLVSVVGDAATGQTALLNYRITAFDAPTGTLTVTPACVIAGNPQQSVEQGDVLIVRSQAMSVSTDGLTVGDPMWNNSVGKNQFGANDPGWAGLDVNAEVGNILRVLHGAGRGQYRSIVANDGTTVTVATPFQNLDTSSIMIIEEANWADAGTSSPQTVMVNHKNIVQVRVPVDNLANEVVLVAGFLNDGNGHLTDEEFAVMREIFVFGQPPTSRTVGPGTGPWEALQTDQTINCATEQNDITIHLPPLADYAGRTLLIYNVGTHKVIVNAYLSSDGTIQETFIDGTTSQTIEDQYGSLRITSTGDYNAAVTRRQRRLRESRTAA